MLLLDQGAVTEFSNQCGTAACRRGSLRFPFSSYRFMKMLRRAAFLVEPCCIRGFSGDFWKGLLGLLKPFGPP